MTMFIFAVYIAITFHAVAIKTIITLYIFIDTCNNFRAIIFFINFLFQKKEKKKKNSRSYSQLIIIQMENCLVYIQRYIIHDRSISSLIIFHVIHFRKFSRVSLANDKHVDYLFFFHPLHPNEFSISLDIQSTSTILERNLFTMLIKSSS